MKRTSWIALMIALFFAIGLTAQAQQLYGVVTTPNGASTDVVVGADIRVFNGIFDQTTTTNAQGEFFMTVPQGTYEVTTSAPGFTPYTMDLSMPGVDKRIVHSLVPGQSPSAWDFCGIVTETNGNGPVLPGVLVEIIEAGVSTTTDSRGNFCIMDVPANNDYHVRFSKPGYVTQIMDLMLDNNKSIVFSLNPAN
jgi:hypothetical protein